MKNQEIHEEYCRCCKCRQYLEEVFIFGNKIKNEDMKGGDEDEREMCNLW